MPLWYMGVTNVTDEMLEMLRSRNHSLLVESNRRAQLKAILNPLTMIPEEYRKNRNYYDQFRDFQQFQNGDLKDLDASNILIREPELSKKLAQLFTDRVSPILADLEDLARLPKTYMVICEWDGLKDEGLIFSHRLGQANVNVTLAYYETCFHGMFNMINEFKLSQLIVKQINDYLKQNI